MRQELLQGHLISWDSRPAPQAGREGYSGWNKASDKKDTEGYCTRFLCKAQAGATLRDSKREEGMGAAILTSSSVSPEIRRASYETKPLGLF